MLMTTRTTHHKRHSITLALLLGLAPTAGAADFCMNVGGPTYVGKGFRVPSPGRCKPFSGFSLNAGAPTTVTGTACTASDKSRVDFALTTVLHTSPALGAPDSVGFDAVQIPLPLFSGAGTDRFSELNGFHATYGAAVVDCPSSVVPIP
jgi:hypothetical protein